MSGKNLGDRKLKDKENGLVSIIVLMYRAAAYIADTIEMVFAQTYDKWELLLVDDCSGDDSVETMEKALSVYEHRPAAGSFEKIGRITEYLCGEEKKSF